MLTLKLIKEETERVVKGLHKKHFPQPEEAVERAIQLDKQRREAQTRLDAILAESKKYAYIFFNCDEAKSQSSMNIFYNDVFFSDTKAGRKALLSKVEEEVAAGRVNVADMEAVKSAILDGEPTDAAGKMQYGDIERIVAAA